MLSDMKKVDVNQPDSVINEMTKKNEEITVHSTFPKECTIVVKVSVYGVSMH